MRRWRGRSSGSAVQLETQPQAGIAPFSVEIVDPVDLRLLLTAIAQYFNLNLLMDQGISETVSSLNLVDVTIEGRSVFYSSREAWSGRRIVH